MKIIQFPRRTPQSRSGLAGSFFDFSRAEQEARIRQLAASGLPSTLIASICNVPFAVVAQLLRGAA